MHILIFRTDRLGDLLLSLPAVEAIKKQFGSRVRISMVVKPEFVDLFKTVRYVDKVFVYNKSLKDMVKLVLDLRSSNPDLVVVLNPNLRSHILAWFSRAKETYGYKRKGGRYFLTRPQDDFKYKGEKTETEYALDLLSIFGVDPSLCGKGKIFLTHDENRHMRRFLNDRGLRNLDSICVIHTGASCSSKKWPIDKFYQIAYELINEGNAVVFVQDVNDPDCKSTNLTKTEKFIDLRGQLSIRELACLLFQARILISNDSGPVHLANAVGIPAVSIFSRNLSGLSAKRWGPRVGKSILPNYTCDVCSAHKCKKDFLCIKSINTEQVLDAVKGFLSTTHHSLTNKS